MKDKTNSTERTKEAQREQDDLPAFDTLMAMAKEDPSGLESLRVKLCENIVASAPTEYQRRLRGLQFQIDMERKRAKNPMDACISISKLMDDSFDKLSALLNQLNGPSNAEDNHVSFMPTIADIENETEQVSAEIIPLPV